MFIKHNPFDKQCSKVYGQCDIFYSIGTSILDWIDHLINYIYKDIKYHNKIRNSAEEIINLVAQIKSYQLPPNKSRP